ncbi:MAG: radical SAM protein [Syntrophales bacterium]|nr:radical SAM protein [Syntrophales bacterium]
MDHLQKIYIEPTTRCNLRCETCIRSVWCEPEGDMDWYTFKKILESLDGLPGPKTMAWAGIGEPLLHPQLPDMINGAHERGLRTEITTNGLLLDEVLAMRLLDAGLDQLSVSIDGVTESTYEGIRRGASITTVVENVRFLYRMSVKRAKPIRIGIVFVAMKKNIRELPSLGEIARAIGASFILVTNFIPYREDMVEEILYRVKPNLYESLGTPQFPLWIWPNMDFNSITYPPFGQVMSAYSNISFLDFYLGARSNYCPFIHAGCVAISWQGQVSPCPPLLHSYTCFIRKRPKLFYHCEFGRIGEESLSSIWNKDDFVSFRARVRSFDFPPCTDCGGCDLSETNETDCLANPFPVCGDCLWARGILRCP